jgi:hypothetical protein
MSCWTLIRGPKGDGPPAACYAWRLQELPMRNCRLQLRDLWPVENPRLSQEGNPPKAGITWKPSETAEHARGTGS